MVGSAVDRIVAIPVAFERLAWRLIDRAAKREIAPPFRSLRIAAGEGRSATAPDSCSARGSMPAIRVLAEGGRKP
jgi:hypothetical protein